MRFICEMSLKNKRFSEDVQSLLSIQIQFQSDAIVRVRHGRLRWF